MFLYFVHGTVPLAVKVDTSILATQPCQQVHHFFIPQSNSQSWMWA